MEPTLDSLDPTMIDTSSALNAAAPSVLPLEDPALTAAVLAEKAAILSDEALKLSEQLLNGTSPAANAVSASSTPLSSSLEIASSHAVHGSVDPLTFGITIFILACFVGYYVVWKVTPALHTPLMAVTNAISGIIVVGAMIAMGASLHGVSSAVGLLAVVLASINIFGGFIVTQRMLYMFRKKKK